jgi:hypothetical protein
MLRLLPRDRVLTETDYPYSKSRDPSATRPGRVARAIALLASAWSETPSDVVGRTWTALRAIDASGRLRERVPVIRDQLAMIQRTSAFPGPYGE